MTQRLLVIGLDAVETPLLEELMAAGELPAMAALRERSVSTAVEATCMSSLPGAIWQDILTGRSAWRHGDYFPLRVHSGERAIRDIDATMHAGTYYFDVAARAGRRGIVIDQPLVPAYRPPADLTLVAEWHVHDAIWARGTYPQALLGELEERFGHRPYDRCDTNHTDTSDSLRAFTDTLAEELSIKTDMAEYLMATRDWDHVAVGISEGHCAGHQLWHQHDETRRDPGLQPQRDSLVVDTYRAIDRAVGRLITAAGEDCAVAMFTSHGMESYVGGPQLLGPLLEAWGVNRPTATRALLRKVAPKALLGRLFRRVPWLLRTAARQGVWTDRLSSHTTAIEVPNNRVGALRVNLAGREPDGTVRDLDATLTQLEKRLHGLRHAESGEAIVERTIRTADAYGPDRHGDLPDLLVVFRRDLGELTAVRCPQAGLVEVPIRRPHYQRTGDHTDNSRIWIDHRRVRAVSPMRSEDIAATLLALLDVPRPDGLDGRVAVELSETARA